MIKIAESLAAVYMAIRRNPSSAGRSPSRERRAISRPRCSASAALRREKRRIPTERAAFF